MDNINETTHRRIGINWTPETGYPAKVKRYMYPRPIPGAGNHLGLTVVLDANINDYYCSSTYSYGFKVLLHNPTETPKIADFGYAVAPGIEAQMVIKPRLEDATNIIKKISKNVRNCVFENEGNLSYYR